MYAGHSKPARAIHLSNVGGLGDGAHEDADTVGPQVLGHGGADRHHDDVGVGLVLEDDLLSLLDGQPDHLRPRSLLSTGEVVGGTHLRSTG